MGTWAGSGTSCPSTATNVSVLDSLPAGTRVPSGVVACPPSVPEVARLAARYPSSAFRPHLGTLGDALLPTATALDPAAAVVLTETAGVPSVVPRFRNKPE